ncbi:MAG: hypothetical protein HOO06_07620 [Bdellovibrionaceae bacterium]|jgi:ankyrin repeat protein|nr:hypothetical protein [Pseudobdellovibrionaceae bacterium]
MKKVVSLIFFLFTINTFASIECWRLIEKSRLGDLEAVKTILANNPTPDCFHNAYETEWALTEALANSHLDIVKELIKSPHAGINARSRIGYPIEVALRHDHPKYALTLLEVDKLDVNKLFKINKRGCIYYCDYPLREATRKGWGNVVNVILNHPTSNPNGLDRGVATPLEVIVGYEGKNLDLGLRKDFTFFLIRHPEFKIDWKDGLLHFFLTEHRYKVAHGVIEELIRNPDIDVNRKTKLGTTPLMKLYYTRDEALIDSALPLFLKRKEVDVNNFTKNRRSSVISAAIGYYLRRNKSADRSLRLKHFLMLAERPELNFNLANRDGDTPILLAQSPHKDRQELFSYIYGRADVDLTRANQLGTSLLHGFAKIGDLKIFKEVLALKNWDLNRYHEKLGDAYNYKTLLIIACEAGHLPIVEELLQNDININYRPKLISIKPALHIAMNKDFAIAEKLLEDPRTNRSIRNAYRNTLGEGLSLSIENFRKLLQYSDIVKGVNEGVLRGETTLIQAINGKRIEHFDELLQLPNIDVNAADKYIRHYSYNRGRTPLMHSVTSSTTYCVLEKTDIHFVKGLLIHPDIKINIQNPDGYTALHWAAICDNEEAARLLIQDSRIDICLKTKHGETAKNKAANSGSTKVYQLLDSLPDNCGN